MEDISFWNVLTFVPCDGIVNIGLGDDLGPLLITCINYNPCLVKYGMKLLIHAYLSMLIL